ncbi:MAG: ATP-dependent RNA helicase HrpA [Enterobacterales bacterium]|nr:ATP-dependent RNA helicase HrpA [Enterobacterales bacterium]
MKGRTFPVELHYLPLEEELEKSPSGNNSKGLVSNNNDQDPMLAKINQAIDEAIARSSGDILIFSNGEAEIKAISKYLEQQKYPNVVIMPLYARLGIKEQQRIFKPHAKRKIIIATNVAETSLTIPNIVFVIDTGTARISRYSHRNKIQQLPIEKISQASAEQRKGRCGRVSAGVCFRLYSEDDYNQRAEYTSPEIKRTNLSSVVLRLKSLAVDQVEKFPFIDSPDEKQWRAAFNQLFELGAMDGQQKLTSIAKQMSQLPLDPQLARIMINADKSLLDECIIIASFLSVRDVRLRPQDKQQKADQCHLQFVEHSSDIMTIVKMWRILKAQRESSSSSAFRRWCQKHFINFIGWLEWRNIYFQIKEAVQGIGISISSTEAESAQVHYSLVSGFISHVMIKTNEAHYQGARGVKVWIHPSSQFFKKPNTWLVSSEMLETEKVYARGNFPIEPEWLSKIAPHVIKSNYYDPHWRKKKGQVTAFLNQTLLGLPVIVKKPVDYSKQEPQQARQIFLSEALVKDQLAQDFPFILNNRELIQEIDLEEQKQRNRSIRIDDSTFVELFAERLPDSINSHRSLSRWLKKDWKKRNKILSFDRQQLSQNESQSIEQYPGQINVRGVELNLSYQFSPGEASDGVTVTIPTPMLQQFNQSDFDWLVPGYLNQKILATLKNLVKAKRKQLIPLAETADAITKEVLSIDYSALDFRQTICQCIRQIKGINLQEKDIDLDNIDNHLKMKFVTNKVDNKKYKITHALIDLKRPEEANKNNNQNQTVRSKQKYYSWPSEFVSLEYNQQQKGMQIRTFHAIVDCQHHVTLQDFSSLRLAEQAHQQGIARLLLIDQLQAVKSIKNGWPDRQHLERLNLRAGGFNQLFDWISISVAFDLVSKYSLPIESEQVFNDFCKQCQSLTENIAERLTNIKALLKAQANVYQQLDSIEAGFCMPSIKDIRQQLKCLWQLEHFLYLGDDLESHYSRYLEGIYRRIKRITENFPKETQALSIWLDWFEWWQDLQDLQLIDPGHELLKSVFWDLEEYRLSLFAPSVKTKISISAKKLQKMFERIESLERR